jgi:hypothetical protein
VRVEGTLDAEGLKLLNHGLSLDGEALRPAKVSWLNEDQLRFVLREGKKRQIRRMCELVGLKVVGLKRVRIGRVMLGNLPPASGATWPPTSYSDASPPPAADHARHPPAQPSPPRLHPAARPRSRGRGGGFAADERRYEGLLLPDDFGGPISVSIELRKLQGLLVGEFKAESPFSGNGRVTSGDMNGSKCDFHVQTGAGPILHLTGTCTATTFEGKYRQAERNDAGSRGSFRLASKPAEEADDTQSAAARKAAAPASVTQCIEPTPAACSAARRPTRTRPSCAPASAAAASRAARAAPRCAEPARARANQVRARPGCRYNPPFSLIPQGFDHGSRTPQRHLQQARRPQGPRARTSEVSLTTIPRLKS